MIYQSFVFEDYQFDADSKLLSLTYSFDSTVTFREVYRFDFPFAGYDDAVLDRACQLLFFMAGVSYFKAYAPPKVVVKKGQIDQVTANFLSNTYQRGLGEFWYVNKLDPKTKVDFPVTEPETPRLRLKELSGSLIGVGGGKDSLVTIEILRDTENVATWSLNHQTQLKPLVSAIGLPHYTVERQIDPRLLELNQAGALNGHIPISAIMACAGTITAILSGHQDQIVSNEYSANEPTLHYKGVAINHQYSKTSQFETDFQELLRHHFGSGVRYYSFLRPLSEIHIAEFFAKGGFKKYQSVFSSCNRAFTLDSDHLSWCGECPKCAFVFLALTPFVERQQLERLFEGRNMLTDSSTEPLYRQLLGTEGDKPLDCVGEIQESRAAMRLAQKVYPELSHYKFELPDSYDYKALMPDGMPTDMRAKLLAALQQG